jgi:hypothetical protein
MMKRYRGYAPILLAVGPYGERSSPSGEADGQSQEKRVSTNQLIGLDTGDVHLRWNIENEVIACAKRMEGVDCN